MCGHIQMTERERETLPTLVTRPQLSHHVDIVTTHHYYYSTHICCLWTASGGGVIRIMLWTPFELQSYPLAKSTPTTVLILTVDCK